MKSKLNKAPYTNPDRENRMDVLRDGNLILLWLTACLFRKTGLPLYGAWAAFVFLGRKPMALDPPPANCFPE
ncbi:MAG: hypothetical protein OXM55_04600 [Bdellovibrionales bacterium]|nr:hypothetical protein [Bdellovibrionales bacterium]